MEHKIGHYLGRFDSQVLCTLCGALTYSAAPFVLGSHCLNVNCSNVFPSQFPIVKTDDQHISQLLTELDVKRSRICAIIRDFNRDALAHRLIARRKDTFRSIMDTGSVSTSTLIAIERTLLFINQCEPEGLDTNEESMDALLDIVGEFIKDTNNLENTQLGRYVMTRSRIMAHNNDGFIGLVMNYWLRFNEDLTNYGLVSNVPNDRENIDKLFLYADIDFADYDMEGGTDELDAVRTLERLAPTGVMLDKVFHSRWWLSQAHRHTRNPLAMSVLYGWYYRLPDIDNVYREYSPDLNGDLDSHFVANNIYGYTASDFIEEYVDSRTLVPYVVRVSNGLLFDRISLLFYLLYLYVQDVPDQYGRSGSYGSASQIFSQKRGYAFPRWLKSQLRQIGYECPVVEKVIAEDGVEFEYDLIAVDETRQKILLIEAKFRDIPASSMNASNLVAHVLEGADGMLSEMVRHGDRLQFALAHPARIERECRLQAALACYELDAVLVSKASPLLSRLGSVKWMRTDEFLSAIRIRDDQ